MHGTPTDRVFKSDDFINLDMTAFKNGLHGDNNASVPIDSDKCHKKVKDVILVAREARDRAISICKPGVRFSAIGKTIEE